MESKSKKYYAYFISEKKQGICDNWNECEIFVSGVNGARYRGFKTREEAEKWLRAGAHYELKPKVYGTKANLVSGIYFDAGTGRGNGVEISLTDENGKNLLHKVLIKKMINSHGKHLILGEVTNNYGELLACKYALKLAIKEGIKKIFGDSKLVIEYWSQGILRRKLLPKKTIKLAEEVFNLRKEFESAGGKMGRISGGDNPADLGFH